MAQLAFDTQFYLSQYPDVAVAISRGQFSSAQEHYNLFGRFESRNPNAYFDTTYYLTQNADVAAARVNPFEHFLNFGAAEGRFSNAVADAALDANNNNRVDASEFDSAAYLAANADVAAAVGPGKAFETAYEHYVLFGQFETRAGTPAGGPFTNTGSTPGTGSTLALTVGVDTVNGTAGADTFNALNVGTDGTAATTFGAFDKIDGGAGVDALNIYTDATNNASFASTASVKNVEIVNVFNTTTTAAALGDASKFQGVTQLWQNGVAAAVTNLGTSTTAGFKDITSGTATLSVTALATAASAAVALSNVTEGSSLTVKGDTLSTVNLSGTVVDGTDGGTDVSSFGLTVEAGKDVQTVAINSAVATTLSSVTNVSGSTKALTTVDASASTGAITYSAASTVTSIKTGSAADTVTVATVTSAASGSTAAVGATVSTGTGNDSITVNTSGNGTTTIDAGAGNDTVAITARGSGVLSVNLGEGNDTFTSAVAINGTDIIDAGAGTDTLLLSLVGSANISAFSNFDAFDAAGLGRTLDVDILASKNTVSEFVASADVGTNAALTNIGAGVGFRATADLGASNTLSLTQKVAGALTVTVDADEVGPADTGADAATVSVNATNATSLKAVFDTSYLANIASETTSGDNLTTLNLSGVASTLSVVSSGANATNVLSYTDSGVSSVDTLTSVTITGDRALSLSFTDTSATKLATIDASAQTGGLTASLASLKDGGSISLGSGHDVITVTNASNGSGIESISGFEKAAAVAVSTVAADATAKAAAIADTDHIVITSTQIADTDFNGSTAGSGTLTGGAVANGVLSFTGTGPASLAAAIDIANLAAETTGEAVAFQYGSDTYFFRQGGATATDDVVVKLTGVTGVTNLAEDGTTDHFFIV